jgi:hypothetical protein
MRVVFTEIVMQGAKDAPKQELRASVGISYSQAQLLVNSLNQALAMAKNAPKV